MNIKYVLIAAISAIATVQSGCETPQTTNSQPPPRRQTPKERATSLSKSLWERTRPLLAKHDYDAARKMALSGRERDDAAIADMMLKVRLGLVTSVINPAELEWRIESLSKKIDAFCAAGDFDSAYAALAREKKHWNDMQFTSVEEVLGSIRKELGRLYYSDSAAKAYVDKYRSRIGGLINERNGELVFRSELSGEIDRLGELVEKEMPENRRDEVGDLVDSMKGELLDRNLTTSELERFVSKYGESKMAHVANSARRAADSKAEQGAKKEQGVAALRRIEALQAKVAIMEALSRGVDIDDEIDLMENAADKNRFGRGGLFAECARGLRTLLPANAAKQLDYQDLLSAAVLLGRRDLMEMAVKGGADVKKAAPRDSRKTVPLELAVEIGSKSAVAWLCDKGARGQVAPMSAKLLGVAVRKNRLDMFKYLQNAGCSISPSERQSMFSLCCEVGADNLHDYLFSAGARPAVEDFVKAVAADNLIIVKWFVETRYFSVNAPGVAAAAEKNPGVRSYLCARGMQ